MLLFKKYYFCKNFYKNFLTLCQFFFFFFLPQFFFETFLAWRFFFFKFYKIKFVKVKNFFLKKLLKMVGLVSFSIQYFFLFGYASAPLVDLNFIKKLMQKFFFFGQKSLLTIFPALIHAQSTIFSLKRLALCNKFPFDYYFQLVYKFFFFFFFILNFLKMAKIA